MKWWRVATSAGLGAHRIDHHDLAAALADRLQALGDVGTVMRLPLDTIGLPPRINQ
jgi:hypothetical protein